MRFDRLKIVGFKTFVDPVEFLIEPGMTGIVGPNGCGKSNLVEALRWVMGETSHKSLRGAGMDDVIFSGSSTRPSRNTAEVVLRIDNADRAAPAAFNDADALEISRRIERSEGSTYRVNGREVRARDVQLLFADAASGARSPSLVRQGQIGEIIAAKPQARRRILEDAAGIAGLHARRHEAELRLKAAQDNLARLEDVLTHLDQQVEALKRQARQAGRYRAVAAQIRRAEALLHLLALADARSRLDALGRTLDKDTLLVAELTRAQGEAARAQAVAEHELEPLRTEEARIGAALQRLRLAREALARDEAGAKLRLAELERRTAELEADLGRDRELAAEAVVAIASLSSEEQTLRERASAGSALAGAAAERLREAEAALEEAEAALADVQAAEAGAAARRAAAAKARHDAEERLARATRQAAAALDDEARLRAGAEAPAAERVGLMAALEAATAGLASAEQALLDHEARHAAAREAEAALRQPVAEAERTAQRLETEARTIRKLVDGDQNSLFAPMLDRVRVDKGYEVALGAALGEDLVASTETAAAAHWRGDLAAIEAEPLPEGATALLAHVEAPPALRARLASIGIVERAFGPVLQARLKPGQRLVTLEGDLWRWDGFVAAANAPTPAARRLAEKNRLGEVERTAADALERRATLRRRAEAAILALREAAAAEADARKDTRLARERLDAARGVLTAFERRTAEFAARLAAAEDTSLRLGSVRDEAARDVEDAAAIIQALPPSTDLSAALAERRAETMIARSRAAEARAEALALTREAEARTERLAAIAAEILRWRSRADRAEAQQQERALKIEASKAEAEALEQAPATFLAQRRALDAEVEHAEAAQRHASDRKAEAETRFATADREARRLLGELAAAREARAAGEARCDAARAKLDEIERLIGEQLEARPSDLPRLAGLAEGAALPPADLVEQELAELRRERDRIGAVNLQADTELENAEAGRGSLLAERDDLNEAIRKLRRGIESLNGEGRQRLLAAFEVVNGHFRRLFATLFGGGEAELTLIESDDPLEAGLEIIAKPPGKKPQVLTLLSGGEQALTASALIFAVFLTNPSPVCVLDEIDAPLDDANVDRLCTLLGEMVRETETRFITITHNPITMARMDRLFGVTMTERGVSQLVSVDLGAAERLVEQA